MILHACNSSAWEAKAVGSRVQGRPRLYIYSELESNLGYMRLYLRERLVGLG